MRGLKSNFALFQFFCRRGKRSLIGRSLLNDVRSSTKRVYHLSRKRELTSCCSSVTVNSSDSTRSTVERNSSAQQDCQDDRRFMMIRKVGVRNKVRRLIEFLITPRLGLDAVPHRQSIRGHILRNLVVRRRGIVVEGTQNRHCPRHGDTLPERLSRQWNHRHCDRSSTPRSS